MAQAGPWLPGQGSLVRATGHGEVWDDWSPTAKFAQFGWRCSTNESSYSHKTLMGNWNEERFSVQKVVQPKPLPSQYSHCFETTYSSDFDKGKHQITRRFKQEPHWFPGHQPELEPPPFKPTEQSCYMIDYTPPYESISFASVQGLEKEQEDAGKTTANLQTAPPEGPVCQLCYKDGLQDEKSFRH